MHLRRLIAIVSLLMLVWAAPAMAQQSKTNMISEINTNLPDNASFTITPAIVRSTLIDIVRSYVDPLSGSQFAQAGMLVGNASGVPSVVVMSGDCTMTFAAVITCTKLNGVTAGPLLTAALGPNFALNSNNLSFVNAAAGSVLANCTASSAEPTASTWTACMDRNLGANNGAVAVRAGGVWGASAAPVLGIPGTTAGGISFAGLTSGIAAIASQTVQGSPTLTLPNASGTFGVSATAPIALNATTGNITCAGCVAFGRTPVADVNYTVVSTDVLVSYTSLTASRSVQLPAASSFVAGRILYLEDASGSAGTSTLAIVPNGTDTIDGVNSAQSVISTPFGRALIISDGATKWTVGKTAIAGDVVAADYGGKAIVATIQPNAITTGKINASAVTYAKIQNETAATLLGNPTGGAAAPSEITLVAPVAFSGTTLGLAGAAGRVPNGATGAFTATPSLGTPGSVQGTLALAGLTSGTATFTPQGVAGATTLTLPNTSGTLADGASAPIVLSATTGNLTCPTCVTSSGGGAITGTAPVSVSAAGAVSVQGATGQVLTGSGGTGSAFTATPTLGAVGSQGILALSGITSGTVTQTTQAAAGTPTITWGSSSGTPAVATTAPLSIATATGNISISGAAGQVPNGATGAFTATPTLGVAGTTLGTLSLTGNTSGTVLVTPQAAAGATTLTLPNTSGTLAASATAPIALSATTGGLSLNANGVTNSFLATMPANTFKANATAGVAAPTDATLGATLSFSGGGLTTNAMTGDVTTSANSFATTISANAVTNAKMATMAANTVKANATGGAATPTDVTPATARSSSLLDIDQLTGHGDSIYTILSTDRTVATNAAFTASRTWTLPAASGVNAGQQLLVADFQGTVTATNTLVITRAGADTVNGGTSVTINSANGAYLLWSDGVSKWTAQQIGGGSVSGVSSLGGLTGAISVSGGIAASGSSIVNVGIHEPCGRLTISTGNPVMTATVTGATSHFFSPYNGCQFVPIFNGTIFVLTDTAGELTQTTADTTKSPAAVTTNSNYDVFVWNDAGTIRATRGPTWNAGAVAGSDVARGTGAGSTELQRLNGIWTNKNAITNGPAANRGTYVGSFRSNSSSTIDYQFGSNIVGGGPALLYVWNAYNRVAVATEVADATGSWTSTSATVGALDSGATGAGLNNRISILSGLAEDAISIQFTQRFTMAAVAGAIATAGFQMDNTNAYDRRGLVQSPAAANFGNTITPTKAYSPQLGQHFFQALQASDGTNTATWNGGGTAIDSALQIVWRN